MKELLATSDGMVFADTLLMTELIYKLAPGTMDEYIVTGTGW